MLQTFVIIRARSLLFVLFKNEMCIRDRVNSKKKEWLFNILGVIGIMLLFIAVITGFIERIFGLFLGMLITLTFPAVIVDAVYAAIYIRKHPEYEEL